MLAKATISANDLKTKGVSAIELDAALTQTRADMAAGRMVQESPEAHLVRLDAMFKFAV